MQVVSSVKFDVMLAFKQDYELLLSHVGGCRPEALPLAVVQRL